jgi:hypothetical protein
MQLKTLQTALDSYTKDNRGKRKSLQQKAAELAKAMGGIAQHATEGQKAMQQLYTSVETALGLAKHSEGWAWKDTGHPPIKLQVGQ